MGGRVNVGEPIEKLQTMNHSLPVKCYWESGIRTDVDLVSDKFNPNYVVLFDNFDVFGEDRAKLEDLHREDREFILKLTGK